MRHTTWLVLTAVLSGCAAPIRAQVSTPEAYLGHAVAADSKLPDWKTVRGYFEALAAQSPRVRYETVGKTAEGRDFGLATISSEQNLAHLDELRRWNALLADPRGATVEQRAEALEKGRVFLCISNAMHATECAAPQFAMQFAHTLATSDAEPWKSAREQCVVLVIPCTNPDGQDHVAEWYGRTVGTPFEGSELTKLYQLYAGHDNNRDWFTLTQPETRIVTRLLYEVWRPQVYWDVHQMGSKAERMFVPPFRDPLDPNLDPGIITAINLLGTRAQLDMTREGKSGVASGGTFDMWWNGGNRNVPVRHNIVGLLTEAASCRLASPIFQQRSDLVAPDGTAGYAPSNRFPLPWPGGWWRLASIVDYEMAFARSLVASLARERRFFLENALEAADRTIAAGRGDGVTAWILPADQRDRGATRRLVDVLLATGVEMSVADEPIVADGRTYPRGSIVIDRAQPYGAYAKDLFDVQQYPDGDPPYDVAGWTLPFLFGVRRVEVVQLGGGRTRRVTDATAALAHVGLESSRTATGAEGLDSRDSDTWARVFRGLAGGESFELATKGSERGTFSRRERGPDGRVVVDEGTLSRAPRIGLYAPWSGNMDEGWMRWVFDTHGVKYTTVRNEMLRAGDLAHDFDVLVLPGVESASLDHGRADGSAPAEYTGGLGAEGAAAIEEFVRGGGNLVAIGGSARWAIELMDLPLFDVTAGADGKEFSCPGSVLRTVPNGASKFVAGLDDSVAIFFSRGSAWREADEKERANVSTVPGRVDVLLRYAPERVLLSGWIRKPETIEGRAAWVRAAHGQGSVHLFGFRPQYRGWSQAAFQLLFRALLLEERAR